LINRGDIPVNCRKVLGNTNGTIVYHLVEDLISNSLAAGDGERLAEDWIGFSPTVSDSLQELKEFNYRYIYLNELIKRDFPKIQQCYRVLFQTYLDHVTQQSKSSAIYKEMLNNMNPDYLENQSAPEIVRDFVAGMTDDYFLKEAAACGCEIPEKI